MKAYGGWLIAGLCLAALIYLQLCHTAKPTQPDNTANLLKLSIQKTKDTAAYYEQLLKAGDAATELAVTKAEDAYHNQLTRENDLLTANKQINELSVAYAEVRSKLDKPHIMGLQAADTTWYTVPPEYVTICDSLDVKAKDLTFKNSLYVAANKNLQQLVVSAQQSYDKQLQVKTDFTNFLQKQLDSCHTSLAAKIPERRTQVYAGINLVGNKTYFIDGGQARIMLLTKRNTMFEANAGLIHGEIYYGVGTAFLLSFRRK